MSKLVTIAKQLEEDLSLTVEEIQTILWNYSAELLETAALNVYQDVPMELSQWDEVRKAIKKTKLT